jgi:PII-like signaling protein
MTGRGLLTLEQARLVTRQLSPDALADFDGDTGDAAKLTVYVSRQERITGEQAYYTICDLLYQHGFAGAIVLLGVDGTVHGERYPALFFGLNINVPVIIITTGSTAQVSTAATELAAVVPNPLLTVERARLCKRDGELFPRPQQLARFRYRRRADEPARADDQ